MGMLKWPRRSATLEDGTAAPPAMITADAAGGTPTTTTTTAALKSGDAAATTQEELRASDEYASGDEAAQQGVKDIEATTTVWSKKWIIAAYIMIWVIYFVDSIQSSTTSALTPYVTSAFKEHNLTATTSVFSQLIGGLSKLVLAKILDIWGRPQGYLLCVVLLTLGLIMMAVCRNVETYAAAQVFYSVGFVNLGYTISVFIADTSALKNRGLMLAFASSPYIITAWIGGPIAEAFLAGPGFRWGFGIYAIVTPVATLPLFFVFWHNFRKAKRLGLVPQRESGRTSLWQSVVYYLREFDALGLLLITAGLALILVPFNIAPADPESWTSARILVMLVLGVALVVAFVLWEKYWAPVTFMPYELLTDRTILGACCLAAALFVSYYIWTSFFPSFLQVVLGQTVTEASYIGNIYSVGSCLWSFLVGWLIIRYGRIKWIALLFGVPMTVLGVGLMIYFRHPGVNIGYIVMCEIFVAFAGGTLVICEQMAVMAPVSHQHVATAIALEAMFAAVGGAIGSTVASAIWGGIFPARLRQYLPAGADYDAIYGSLETQLGFPVGSPTRDAIVAAYSEAQKYMLITAVAIHVVSFISVAVWRDMDMREKKQVKGVVA